MTEASERDIILEHALENENNLGMAVDIALAYQDLRQRVIVDFSDKLHRLVRQQLNESQWVINSGFRANPFENSCSSS